jgi:hypothetical protein
MGGLPWIKVWTVLGRHPKVQRLERELGIPDALGVVVRLWCWTADYHPGGDIPHDHAEGMASVAAGDACPSVCHADVTLALVTAGFLDAIPGAYRVHDWDEMQTTHIEADERRKAQARERQRKHRAKGNVTDERDVTRDVTRDSVTEKEREKEREKKKNRSSAPATPTPFAEARDALVAAFHEARGGRYLWSGAKDSEALKRVLALDVPIPEIVKRWKSGLRGSGWASCSTVAQLAAKWNDLTPRTDDYDAQMRALRDAEDARIAGRDKPGRRDRGGARQPPANGAAQGQLPEDGVSLSASLGAVLGDRWQARDVQNGAHLEPGPERGGAGTPGRDDHPGDDDGGALPPGSLPV